MSFKGVYIFSSGDQFVQQSGTILAFLVDDHPKDHFCEIIWNRATGLGGDVI